MKFWQHVASKIKKEPPKERQEGEARERFLQRYRSFQELLSCNNSVLEMMADMEEKLSGDFIFDKRYVESQAASITEGVRNIIENLNMISNERYSGLRERIDASHSRIEAALARRIEIPESDYIIPLEQITRDKTDTVGGKIANLGEIRNRAGLPTPEGFAVTAFAYKRFMDHNGFLSKIEEMVSGIPLDNLEELNRTSKKIQEMILHAEIPPDLAGAITEAYYRLCEKAGRQVLVSVRSSALQEDGEFSFAGQHSTFLQVPAEEVLQRYKEVVASLFTSRAIFYYRTKGFRENDMVMSVGVLEMVDARAGGVMYSRDPNDPESDILLVNAVKGFGKGVVDGDVTPETYVIARSPDASLIGKRIPFAEGSSGGMAGRKEGGVGEHHLAAQEASLKEEEMKMLAKYALLLEEHYGAPQDIEWAFDSLGRPFVLQTRPLRILKRAKRSVPTRIPGYRILIDRGVIASKGVGFGKVFFVQGEEDLQQFPDGAVLVARHTSTKYVTVMNRASAIVTDVGGTAGHMASLAREFRLPTILDTETATKTLRNGQEVTVDALNCNIYEGRVQELIDLSDQRKEEPFRDTELFQTLESVLKWIVPLHLVDPRSEQFRPESCESLHDITRFAHEKVMQEMFKLTGGSPLDELEAAVLKGRIPLEVHLIDLGGGIDGGQKKLKPEDVHSVPFNAFYKGLLSMRWPEPRPVDAKGFLGMIAQSASIPESDLHKIGEKSFAFISGEYMNFSIRLGYHLSTVEAYLGENLNDNYIKFFFEGGGAVRDRKLRRVRLISEIIKKMDFNLRVTEDVIDASLTKYRKSTLEEKLEVMGKLTVYTKQLDMVMYNDAITDWYIDEFVNAHVLNKG